MDLEMIFLAIWLGAFLAVTGCLYVLRWAALVYEMLRPIPPPKYCVGRPHRSWWLAPFVFFNAIPWLLLAGPVFLYRGISRPHATFWDWLLFGSLLGLSWFIFTTAMAVRRAALAHRQVAQT